MNRLLIVISVVIILVLQLISITTAVPCDPKCKGGQGVCQGNGRCLCWWGWSGPNAVYITYGVYKNRILADYCTTACHYTSFYRNPLCVHIPTPPSTTQPSTTRSPSTAVQCDPKCKGGQGVCQSDGRCFCWWGWTGPHAVYIMTGADKNRIKADYCTTACHYTHDYLNPACASIPTPQVCSVPANPIVPPIPCDPLCGTGIYYGRGTCKSNGRCLCWWGWTGPNACYVDGGTYNNRILADRCVDACHYTHVHRNYNCINGSSTAKPSTQPPTTGNAGTGKPGTGRPTTVAAPAVACDPRCKGLHTGGNCSTADGRCYCFWGWTGPHAVYIETGTEKNRIKADYCTTPCHYTHDYLNPACASIPTPQVCSVPANKTVPPIPCDPLCGTGKYFGRGNCTSNGRCLCWWGWTGPNACYVDGGTYNNRILADRCVDACHYTHHHRNYNCTNGSSTAKPSTQPPTTGNPGTGSKTTGQPTTGISTTGKSYQSSTNQQKTKTQTTTSPKTSSTTPKQSTSGQTTSTVALPTTKQKTTTQASTTAKPTTQPAKTTEKPTTVQLTTKQKTTTQASTTTQPATQAATTTEKTTTVQPTTKQKTTTQASTTAKPTTQPAPTTEKATTVQLTTKQKTTTQASTTAQPATQAATTTEKPTTVQPTTKQKTTTQASTTAKPTTQPATTTEKATTVQPTTKQKTTTQASTTTKPATQAATTTEKATTVQPTTKQKTTTQASTTAKPTTQPATTTEKTTTVGTTPRTKQKTTTQGVTTTIKATTTQAATTTEPPEPTEPTEPPEPTEPTEPGGLQVRGMLPDFQNQLQNDVDDSEVEDGKDDEEEEYKEPNKSDTIGLVVVLVVLLVCVTAFGVAVWWTYGNGNQCPSILRGYEPVSGSDANTMMNEFPMSTHVP